MSNLALQLLSPNDPNILVRVVFLHVGQGASALVLAAGGNTYKSMLIDINLDGKCGGIDVPRVVADLVGRRGLDVFLNTHPHNDHLCGVGELANTVNIAEVWHSGHIPAGEHCTNYEDFLKVITLVKSCGGTVTELKASRSSSRFGEVPYYVLSPAQYVKDEIADEEPEVRNARIHEHCAVLKFGLGSSWIMVAGDADRDAWEEHITDYHKERLGAAIFAAPHHGSRTFFRYEEEDEPYLDALRRINPSYVVISAPRREESQFDHPHEDAVALYAAQVGKDNVLHTGKERHSFICDIYRDGVFRVLSDGGVLAKAYPYQTGKSASRSEPQDGVALALPRYVERLRWPEQQQYKVDVTAYTYSKGGKKLGGIRSDSRVLSSNLKLKFVATTNAPKGYSVYWQVVNTGRHAERMNGTRGHIFEGDTVRWEPTLYTGKHWIECFIVRNGACVARSGRFYVKIRNPTFP